MRKLVPLATLLVVAAAGCKPKPEDQVPGTWTGPNNMSITMNKDKSWNSDMAAGPVTLKMVGTWSATGDTVRITPTTVNGQPVAAFAKQMMDVAKRMNLPKNQLDSIGDITSADDFALSGDGKTLTLKNARAGRTMTLTKK